MPQEPAASPSSLIPAQPMIEGAEAFSQRVYPLFDGQPKDEATVAQALAGMDEVVDRIAAGLYSLASMLVGEGEDGVKLVEMAVATAEVATDCSDPLQGRRNSRLALCRAALEMIAQRDSGSLAAPAGLEHASTCIEDDDLDAASESGRQLEQMIAGPDRDRVRQWLAQLPTALRTIFVMRAVAGLPAAETASLLAAHGGPQAAGWSTEAVRETFRQGLCSLASQILQASTQS